MSAPDEQEKIALFAELTGCAPDRAPFYLEASRWDIQTALENYLEAQEEGEDQLVDSQAGSQMPAPRQDPQLQEEPVRQNPRLHQVATSSKPKSKPAAQGKIRSLADFGNRASDDEDDTNEYYTGGSKSGQVVQGADSDPEDVDDYFEKMRGKGHANEEELPGPSSSEGRQAFAGRGRRLDGEDIPGETAQPSSSGAPRPIIQTVTFWRNNVFTVNDGEPRDVLDPRNRPFMDALSRGQAPDELLQGAEDVGAEIKVSLVRSQEDYKAPAAKSKAFAGKGHTLGASNTSASQPPAQPAAASSSTSWEGINEAQPSTSIQLRLADGSRMVARFNHDHLIGDIRRFIRAARPDQPSAYSLMTAFPSAQLTDDSKTIKDAGLLNAVVIQKLAA